jgi:chromosomal replication initiation ATPase DnaA
MRSAIPTIRRYSTSNSNKNYDANKDQGIIIQQTLRDNSTIVLEVANDFCEVWLKDNYMGLLQDVVALASGRQLQVKFKVASGGISSPLLGRAFPGAARETGAGDHRVCAARTGRLRLRVEEQGAYLGFPGQASAAGTAEIEKSIIAQFRLGLPKSY